MIYVENYSPNTRNPDTVAVCVGWLMLYYSYTTVVAFRVVGPDRTHLALCENVWGTTTGEHLGYLRKHPGGVVDDVQTLTYDVFPNILAFIQKQSAFGEGFRDELLAMLGDKEAAERT
jgi:hypothetical protein